MCFRNSFKKRLSERFWRSRCSNAESMYVPISSRKARFAAFWYALTLSLRSQYAECSCAPILSRRARSERVWSSKMSGKRISSRVSSDSPSSMAPCPGSEIEERTKWMTIRILQNIKWRATPWRSRKKESPKEISGPVFSCFRQTYRSIIIWRRIHSAITCNQFLSRQNLLLVDLNRTMMRPLSFVDET